MLSLARCSALLRSLSASPSRLLLGLVLVGVVIPRVWLLSRPGFTVDAAFFTHWARMLTGRPLERFYAPAGRGRPDHLPPDIALHWVVSHGWKVVGDGDFAGRGYLLLLKIVPTLADLGLAVLLFVFLARLWNRRGAAVIAVLFLLLPPLFLTSSLWGQWDSISIFFLALAGVGAYFFPRVWGLFLALALNAVFIKPQLAVLLAPMLFFPFVAVCRDVWRACRPLPEFADGPGLSESLKRLASYALNALAGLALGFGILAAISRPFNVSILPAPGRYPMGELIAWAEGKFPFRTLNAANMWAPWQGHKQRLRDNTPLFMTFTAQQIGYLLLAAVTVAVLAFAVRRVWSLPSRIPTPQPFKAHPSVLSWALWSACILSWAAFFFMTRNHERYLLPCVVATFVLACVMRRRWALGALGAIVTASTLSLMAGLFEGWRLTLDQSLWTLGAVSCLLAGVCLAVTAVREELC